MITLIKEETKDYTFYKSDKWQVGISHSASHNSYFEYIGGNTNIEISGMLELSGMTVIEYDGVYELPRAVCRLLHKAGFTFDDFILPDGLELS